MELSELKRWHWAIVGAAAGAILGFAWMGTEPESGRNLGTAFLQRAFGEASDVESTKGLPVIRDLVVMPADIDPNGNAVQRVTLSYLTRHAKTGAPVYLPGTVNAIAKDIDPKFTRVEQFLDERGTLLKQAKVPAASFATYRHPLSANAPAYYGAWVLGGVALVGGVWPTLVGVLVGAGLAPQKPKDEKFKLSKYKSQGDIDDGVIRDKGKRVVTADDQKQLDDVLARYGGSAGSGSGTHREPVGAGSSSGMPAIRKLEGGPLRPDDAPKPVPQEDEPKTFGGEWYPVARPTKKHD